MIIDFHTHSFADSIAERAVQRLVDVAQVECFTDGTIKGEREKLKLWGVDYGVLLPIATKPKQQHTINDWAKSVYNGNIISFGTVHPDSEDWDNELERIKEMGLKGVKFHPDYQDFFIFEDKMKPIYKKLSELKLPVIFHMGFDPLSPKTRHAMPCHLVDIHEKNPDLIIIGGHLGGEYSWEEVSHYLCGMDNLYLDTAYCVNEIAPEMMTEIINKHGADKILFASDLPWKSSKDSMDFINSLPLTDREKNMILGENAAKLLGIK